MCDGGFSSSNRFKTQQNVVYQHEKQYVLFCFYLFLYTLFELIERNYLKTDRFIEPKTITRGASFTRLDKRRAFRVLLGKAGRKKRLGKPRIRWEDNI